MKHFIIFMMNIMEDCLSYLRKKSKYIVLWYIITQTTFLTSPELPVNHRVFFIAFTVTLSAVLGGLLSTFIIDVLPVACKDVYGKLSTGIKKRWAKANDQCEGMKSND